ncbi:MAG: hypothetical protein V7707_17370 [Motiliproteus sp.]
MKPRWLSHLLVCFMVLVGGLSDLSRAESRKSVLVIESYHTAYQWDADYTRAINDQLSGSTDLTFVQLDTKRRPPSEYVASAEKAWQHYLELQPDLVILGDDNALKYLGPRLADTDTPVVYLGINNNPRNYFQNRPSNISGVLERPLIKRSIVYMSSIMEQRFHKVLVLLDDGTTSKTVYAEVFGGESHRSIGLVDVDVRLIGDYREWQQAILTAPTLGYDAIMIGLYHTITDADGKHVSEQQVITWSSAQAQRPLFGFWSFVVGSDMAIGGYVLDGYEQGKLAAMMAKRVLAGEPLPLLPITSSEGQFVFSRSQLSKWQIDLPQDVANQSTFVP